MWVNLGGIPYLDARLALCLSRIWVTGGVFIDGEGTE